MKISLLNRIIIWFFIFSLTTYTQVVINEVMPSNFSTIADEDGDYSDWIELFNPEDSSINLSAYSISDDANELNKWIFPDINLSPKDHLLIFASDKDRTKWIKYWETIITWGDEWKYFLGYSEPPSAWKDLQFDDQTWLSGSSGFGYGDDDDSTIIPKVRSAFIRKTFTVDDINLISAAILHIDYDDAFVAYLNNTEIARSNIGTPNIPPSYDQSAHIAREATIYQGGKPESFLINNIQNILQEENVLAIQVHNYGTSSSDMSLIPFLSLGKNIIPPDSKSSHPLLQFPFKYLHTNFKLDAEGEKLFVTDPFGNIIDSVFTGRMFSDISFGRQPDGAEDWLFFETTTPGNSNTTQGKLGFASEPEFSLDGGFYSSLVTVSLSADSASIIRYTLDGSIPTEFSSIYSQPIQINKTQIVRARCFLSGAIPGRTITNSYMINFSSSLPVFSISTNPENFFDEETGIYSRGDSASSEYPYFGANFWKDWEKPVHIDFFDIDNSGFSLDAGVKIYGGWSRGRAQKSLAFFARGVYGYPEINYRLFPELPFTDYHSFVLRNSGNDWDYTMFRDGLMTTLLDGVDVDKQDFRPAVLLLNGEYWGILNLREKINEDFIAAHHNLNRDSIDMLENFGEIVSGDSIEYMELYNFIAYNNLSVISNYQHVLSKIDINNFIAYYASQIYFGNTDWPGNNIKYWKKKSGSKWRWIMFDTDFGFNLYNRGVSHNTLNFALEPNGPDWPNPPWSTLFLRKLLDNQNFKNRFINYMADLLNKNFLPAAVVDKIVYMKNDISSEISRHINKWQPFSYSVWESNISSLTNFANQRPGYVRQHFVQRFGLPGNANVNVTVADTSMGSVKLNSIDINSTAWSGIYFQGVPINFIAKPSRGFRFVKWEGSSSSEKDTIFITASGTINLTAVFEIDSSFSVPDIIINEINYNSFSEFNTEDWIELFNKDDEPADISGWIFKDSEDEHSYIIPEGTILEGKEYLVLCIDSSLFKSFFPDVDNFCGNIDFGLSGSGELLRLFDAGLNLIDSLTYSDSTPWPEEADGKGATLSLLNPDLENHLPESWAASLSHGTPGAINDVFVNVEEEINVIPDEYSLYQNFPNPFNPVTTIRYAISKASGVSIKIYDILGNEVRTLINEHQPAGFYNVEFNAENLSSGVYIYRITAGSFIAAKKIILLK
jgi:hypothetical protein